MPCTVRHHSVPSASSTTLSWLSTIASRTARCSTICVGGGVQGGSGLRRRFRRLPGNPPGAFRARRERAEIGRPDVPAPIPLGARVGRLDDVAPGIGDQPLPGRLAGRERGQDFLQLGRSDERPGAARRRVRRGIERRVGLRRLHLRFASAPAEPASARGSASARRSLHLHSHLLRRSLHLHRHLLHGRGRRGHGRQVRRRLALQGGGDEAAQAGEACDHLGGHALEQRGQLRAGVGARLLQLLDLRLERGQQAGVGRHRRLDAGDLARRLEIGVDGQQVDQRQHAGDRQQGPPRLGEVGVRRLQRIARNLLDVAHPLPSEPTHPTCSLARMRRFDSARPRQVAMREALPAALRRRTVVTRSERLLSSGEGWRT